MRRLFATCGLVAVSIAVVLLLTEGGLRLLDHGDRGVSETGRGSRWKGGWIREEQSPPIGPSRLGQSVIFSNVIKAACQAYVFEPNVANTWITVKGMIENFLSGIWKQGGLAGAKPDDAYSVSVGLGSTMTSEDILEGIMRVTVLVAISRPAEFIEMTFQQQMQKS